MATAHSISVSPEIYSVLETQAQARGWSIQQFVEFLSREYEKLRERAFIEGLRADGLIASFPAGSEPAFHDFKPVPVNGEPVCQSIIEDREPH